jgi:hypothetical protein
MTSSNRSSIRHRLIGLVMPASTRSALVGNPLCGDPHSGLEGFLIVETRDRFLDWLKSADSASAD